MTTTAEALLLVVSLAALYVALRATLGAYLTFRGTRVVTCPETGTPAGVGVDAAHAGMTALCHVPELRVASCSQWPEHRDCGQACLARIASAPGECLMRTMLTDWYAGKSCVLCHRPLGEIRWDDRKPALMSAERRTCEWHEVRPETLPEVLATHLPVCWSCHVAETFRRQHPELVVDRPWPRDAQATPRDVAS